MNLNFRYIFAFRYTIRVFVYTFYISLHSLCILVAHFLYMFYIHFTYSLHTVGICLAYFTENSWHGFGIPYRHTMKQILCDLNFLQC